MDRTEGYEPDEDGNLDDGIRELVTILRSEGVETFESCQGGEGHCFPEPTIRFHGSQYEGYRAFGVARMRDLPVEGLSRYYDVIDGELRGPWWEMTFRTTGQIWVEHMPEFCEPFVVPSTEDHAPPEIYVVAPDDDRDCQEPSMAGRIWRWLGLPGCG